MRSLLYFCLIAFAIGRVYGWIYRIPLSSSFNQDVPTIYSTDLIEDCSDDTYALSITDITLTPPTPEPGKDLLIKATGYLKRDMVEGAYADVVVKLGRMRLLKKTFDICQEMEKNDVELRCPVKNGPVEVTQKVTLPQQIPKARYTVEVRAFTDDDEDLACLNVRVDFRHHLPGRLLMED